MGGSCSLVANQEMFKRGEIGTVPCLFGAKGVFFIQGEVVTARERPCGTDILGCMLKMGSIPSQRGGILDVWWLAAPRPMRKGGVLYGVVGISKT